MSWYDYAILGFALLALYAGFGLCRTVQRQRRRIAAKRSRRAMYETQLNGRLC